MDPAFEQEYTYNVLIHEQPSCYNQCLHADHTNRPTQYHKSNRTWIDCLGSLNTMSRSSLLDSIILLCIYCLDVMLRSLPLPYLHGQIRPPRRILLGYIQPSTRANCIFHCRIYITCAVTTATRCWQLDFRASRLHYTLVQTSSIRFASCILGITSILTKLMHPKTHCQAAWVLSEAYLSTETMLLEQAS